MFFASAAAARRVLLLAGCAPAVTAVSRVLAGFSRLIDGDGLTLGGKRRATAVCRTGSNQRLLRLLSFEQFIDSHQMTEVLIFLFSNTEHLFLRCVDDK